MRSETHRRDVDAAFHLLDRQVVDSDDLMVCKVDDLEVSLPDDGGTPAVTRILTGPAALVPRFSGRTGHLLRRRWISLGVQYADRDLPLAIPLDAIAALGSGIELSVGRRGLLDRQPPAPDGVTHRRMGELLGMRVHADDPAVRGKVVDVKLRWSRDRWVFDRLMVGPGRPGSLLGYAHGGLRGPWIVRAVVGRLNRPIHLVGWDAVEAIDWDAGSVTLRPGASAEEIEYG